MIKQSSFSIEPLLQAFRRYGCSRSRGYELINQGLIPYPVLIIGSLNKKGIPSYEIDTILKARISGKTNDEIRALVADLIETRKEEI